MNYLPWLFAALFVFALPGLAIFALVMYGAHTKRPFELANQIDMPEPYRERLIDYLKTTKDRVGSVKYCLVEALSPYMVTIALLFTKWEAERLPKLFWRWDNEVSLNGDKRPWINNEHGVQVPLPCPIEDTPEVRAYCYWLKDAHPRSYKARWVWLVLRNRASMYAFMKGFPVNDALKADTQYWGDLATQNGHEGILVRRMGPHYELFAAHRKGKFCLRVRYGCKIGNALNHGAARAMLIGNGVAIQRWKVKET